MLVFFRVCVGQRLDLWGGIFLWAFFGVGVGGNILIGKARQSLFRKGTGWMRGGGLLGLSRDVRW